MPSQINRGGPGILAIPNRRYAAPRPNLYTGLEASSRPIKSVGLSNVNAVVTGTTMNGSLTPIPNCTVDIFNSDTNAWIMRTTSDGSGVFTLPGPGIGPLFMRAVDSSGNPVGTTINGLRPS